MDYLRGALFLTLWIAFFLLFYRFGKLRVLKEFLQRTKAGMEEAARRRLLNSRSNLLRLKENEGIWFWLEKQLVYSGLKRRFSFLRAEGFLLMTIAAGSVLFLTFCAAAGLGAGVLAAAVFFTAEFLVITVGKAAEMHAVNENLLKFLDFLGNYSVTAGDIIGIFGQIGKYMEEPIRSALEECSVEAQTTGDVGMALLSMADKIEHPQFKELVRNIEVSCRYSADFTVLVSFSRRSMREYLKSGRERKSLLREAGINLLLLLGMSVFALVTVNGLLEMSVWTVLTATWPGRAALGVVGVILLLFGIQIYKLEG